MAVYLYLVTALLGLLCLVYIKICNRFTYWEKRGVKGPKPQIPYGNFKRMFDKIDSIHTITDEIYKQYPNEKVVGIYQGLIPVLLVRDPDLIKRILIKDFENFIDRGFKITDELRTRSMFSQDGAKWRIIRRKLTPMFSTAKLKNMMYIMNKCVSDYMKFLDKIVTKQATWEIRSVHMCYNLKIVTSILFGLDVEFDMFNDEGGAFHRIAHTSFNVWSTTALFLHSIYPGLPVKLGMGTLSTEVNQFFLNLVNQIIKQRKGNSTIRKDFMDLLIELREEGTVIKSSEEGGGRLDVTDEVIIAQALLFFVAGISTSSSSMAFLFYELALNPSIQDRCLEEIKNVMAKYDGELTYESLKEFSYTSMAFKETLRKHPAAHILLRQTVNDYTFPEINLTLKKGTKVFIPTPALHMDEKYFPEPELFKPERFSPENKGLIQDFTYMPFGDGPRNCIAKRFAEVQTMLGIVHFLYRYRVEPCEETVMKIKSDPLHHTVISQDGVWLNVIRR